MKDSTVDKTEELSKPEFRKHADSTDISTFDFLCGFQCFSGHSGRVHLIMKNNFWFEYCHDTNIFNQIKQLVCPNRNTD